MVDNFNCPTGLPDSFYWVTVDTEGKITLVDGNISFSGGKAAPAWGDPSDVSRAPHFWQRQPGLTIEWQVTPGSTAQIFHFGFTDGTVGPNEAHAIRFSSASGNMLYIAGAAGANIPLTYSATSYYARIVCMLQPDGTIKGARYEVSTDGKVTWKLIWVDTTVTTATLYAFIASYSAVLTASQCKVYFSPARPAVLSASPGAPALTLGAELLTNGNMETGDPPSSWTTPDATLDGVADERTGGAGAQSLSVINATASWCRAQQALTLVAGTWYKMDGWAKCISGLGSASIRVEITGGANWLGPVITTSTSWAQLSRIARCPNASSTATVINGENTIGQEGRYDDVSLKPLPFDQTGVLEYIGDAGQHDGIYRQVITPNTGYHQGIVCHASSATAPTTCLMAYYDRTAGKAYFLKQVAGTWTELQSGTIAYAAGAIIQIVSIGTSHAAYYNGTLVGGVQTSLDVSAWGTYCHYFATENAAPGAFEAHN